MGMFDHLIPNNSGSPDAAPTSSPEAGAPRKGMFDHLIPNNSAPSVTESAAEPSNPYAANAEKRVAEMNKNFGGGASDRILQGLTGGYSDEILAGLNTAVKAPVDLYNGRGIKDRYAEEKAFQDAKLNAAQGPAGTALELASSVVGGGGLLKMLKMVAPAMAASPVLSNALLGGVMESGKSWDPYDIGAGVVGGAIGGKLADDAANLAGKAITRYTNGAPKMPEVPSTAALEGQKAALYRQFDSAGGEFTGPAMEDLMARTGMALNKSHYSSNTSLAPGVDGFVSRVAELAGDGAATPNDIQGLRALAGHIGQSNVGNRYQYGISKDLKGVVDQFLSQTPKETHFQARPAPVLADPVAQGMSSAGREGMPQTAQELGGLLSQANATNRKWSQASLLEKLFADSRDATAWSGSGGNIENNTRRAAGKALKARGDWSPEVTDKLNSMLHADPTQNTLRLAGKLSPEGNGLMLAEALHSAIASGGKTIPLHIASFLAKRQANKMATDPIEELLTMVRNGGTAPRPAPVQLSPQEITLQMNKPAVEAGGAAIGSHAAEALR